MPSRKNEEKKRKKKKEQRKLCFEKESGEKSWESGVGRERRASWACGDDAEGVCAAALPGGQHGSWACLGKVLVAVKFWLGPKARRLFVTISAFVQLPQVAFESPRFDCLLD